YDPRVVEFVENDILNLFKQTEEEEELRAEEEEKKKKKKKKKTMLDRSC
ncbi:hypothetical protein A2U01_0083929, partial [Trifolium medium]|nr:hypothetical protein [Trifolium medium]